MSNFQETKQQLISSLNKISEHVLFPQSLIAGIRAHGFRQALGHIENYNNNILKSRQLIVELGELQQWGAFWNSEYLWKVSVEKTVAKHLFERNLILSCSASSNPFDMMFYKQSNISKDKLLAFMQITINSDGKMVLAYKNENGTENTEIDVSPSKIPFLLPRFPKSSGAYYDLDLYYLDTEELARLKPIEQNESQVEVSVDV